MVKVNQIKAAKGFSYSDAPQRSPEWLALRIGRVGASDLHRWLAVAKKPDKDGVHKPLKARLDLEREIAFGKAFGVPFSKYVNGAMQEGIDNEDFVRDQYIQATGNKVETAGAFYDDHSIASPDGFIGEDGGLEIKWLQDNAWTEVLVSKTLPEENYAQVQGNLRASGRKWWDYAAANGSTGRFLVIRVLPDKEFIAKIDEAVKEVANVEPLSTDNVYQFNSQPQPVEEPIIW